MSIKRDNEAIAQLYTEQLLKEYDVRDDLTKDHWCKDKDDPKVLHPKGDPDCAEEEDSEEAWLNSLDDWEWAMNVLKGKENFETGHIEFDYNGEHYILQINDDGSAVGIVPNDEQGKRILEAVVASPRDYSIDPEFQTGSGGPIGEPDNSGSSSWR